MLDWLIVTYRLPGEPSRHRVAVWRELRRAGAVALQQATWALPATTAFLGALDRAVALVDRAGGEAMAFRLSADDDEGRASLERLFTEAREAEWTEFRTECERFEEEIEKEVRTAKFTLAELDEEEQSLERLRRWFRDIRSRDLFLAPSHAAAEGSLKECVEALERFAERVYQEGATR